MKEAGKKLKKILGILGIASVLFFVVTFIVYFFNLDMRACIFWKRSLVRSFGQKRQVPGKISEKKA